MIVDYLHTENTDGHGCPQADGESEHEFTRIIREFKEIGPQADGGGEHEFTRIYSHIANIKKSSSSYASFREVKAIGPQADEGCDE